MCIVNCFDLSRNRAKVGKWPPIDRGYLPTGLTITFMKLIFQRSNCQITRLLDHYTYRNEHGRNRGKPETLARKKTMKVYIMFGSKRDWNHHETTTKFNQVHLTPAAGASPLLWGIHRCRAPSERQDQDCARPSWQNWLGLVNVYQKNDGTSPCLTWVNHGKSTSFLWPFFNSKLVVYQRLYHP